jgi:hypothetical protein
MRASAVGSRCVVRMLEVCFFSRLYAPVPPRLRVIGPLRNSCIQRGVLEGDRQKEVRKYWNFQGQSAHAIFLHRQRNPLGFHRGNAGFFPLGARPSYPTGIRVGMATQIAQAADGLSAVRFRSRHPAERFSPLASGTPLWGSHATATVGPSLLAAVTAASFLHCAEQLSVA